MTEFMSSEWGGDCRSCPCADNRFSPTRRGKAYETVILVDHPTALEQAKKLLLQGDTGNLVKQVFRAVGIEPTNCYLMPALNCRPNMKKEKMVKNAMFACKDRTLDELRTVGAKRVLCLGPVGFSQIMDAERVLPITKVRGKWHQRLDMDVLATFNPGWLFGERDYFRDFADDIVKFATTKPEPSPNIEIWEPGNLGETFEAFEYLSEASFISFDVETTGLSTYRDELLAVGFGALHPNSRDGVSVILHQAILEAPDTWAEIGHLLSREDQASVAHHAKFDLKWFRHYLLKFGLPYEPRRVEDTMMLHYTLDERPMGRFKSHSLKNMARIRKDAPDYDINMGKWLKEWEAASPARRTEMRKEMHEYLALDCYFTAAMFPDLIDEVMEEDPALMNHYNNTLMPGIHALVEIEEHGAKVDRKYFEEQWEDLQARAVPILERIRAYTEKPEFNPNSPKQVAEFLYDELQLPVLRTARRGKLQEGKTSKAILKLLIRRMKYEDDPLPDHIEFLQDIMQYRNLIKNAGTYVKGLLMRMDTDDRIRCDLLPHGTATGRLSSTNPNLQNIPEKSHTGIDIRAGYIAPEGYLLFNADYSQLELRVAFDLSGDTNGRQVYIEGRDLHQEVVYALYGTSKEDTTPYMRYLAKCMSFGALYCRGPQSLANGPEMDMVEETFGGTRWTVQEAKEFFEKWFANFPSFKKWSEEISSFAYKNQYIQTPFGNKRRFPFIPRNDNGEVSRQAINSPIQGTAALITFAAFTRIHNRFKELNAREGKTVAHLILTVHDSIMGEFLPAYMEEVKDIVIEEMEGHCPIPFSVPLKADIEVAPNWGIIKEWNSAEELPVYLEEAIPAE